MKLSHFFLITFVFVTVVPCAASLADEDQIAPGDNLVCQGIPPIPAQLADAVRPFTEFRGAMLCSTLR